MRRGLLFLAVGSSLALAGCMQGDWGMHARATVNETRALAKDGAFSIENTNGRVEVTGWDEAKVSIEATKRAVSDRALQDVQVEITGEGESLSVRTRHRRSHFFGGGGRVDYVVRVPRGARVHVSNVNGRVEVDGVAGAVEASNVNGSVDVHDAGGTVAASNVNGSVEVAMARVDAQSKSELHTTNGSVRLTLPADANAEIDARTVNGGVGCDFDLAQESRSRRRLEGRIGAGGARFELRSVNGSVNVDRGLSSHAAERQPAEAPPASEKR
jgi:hypothetical protein